MELGADSHLTRAGNRTPMGDYDLPRYRKTKPRSRFGLVRCSVKTIEDVRHRLGGNTGTWIADRELNESKGSVART